MTEPTVVDLDKQGMDVSQFAALATETPDPTREPAEGGIYEVTDPENLPADAKAHDLTLFVDQKTGEHSPVHVWVADDRDKRYKGLANKTTLQDDEGMLFDWGEFGLHGLTMRSMSFPIDMVFLDERGHVQRTIERVDPSDDETYQAACRYALELPAGFCEKHEIGTDCRVYRQTLEEPDIVDLNKTSKQWQGPFEGERGGTYWQHEETGDRRYDPPPGEDGDGDEEVSEEPDAGELLDSVEEGDDVEVEYYSPGSGEDSISGTVESVDETGIEVSTVFGTEHISSDFIEDLDIEGEPHPASESDDVEDDTDEDVSGEETTEVPDPESSQEPDGEPMSSVETSDVPEDFDLTSEQREAVTDTLDSAIDQHDVDVHTIESNERTLSIGLYRHGERSIQFNPHEFNSENAENWHEDGYLATDSVQGLVAHEMAHAVHFQDVPDFQLDEIEEWHNDEHREIAGQVSEYAQENPVEFIAEVGSMKMLGEEIPEDVERVYQGYVGPDLEELDV